MINNNKLSTLGVVYDDDDEMMAHTIVDIYNQKLIAARNVVSIGKEDYKYI